MWVAYPSGRVEREMMHNFSVASSAIFMAIGVLYVTWGDNNVTSFCGWLLIGFNILNLCILLS